MLISNADNYNTVFSKTETEVIILSYEMSHTFFMEVFLIYIITLRNDILSACSLQSLY